MFTCILPVCVNTDIRLDWQLFNVTPNDTQLIDFVVNYGEPFPLRDAHGNEIVRATATAGVNAMPNGATGVAVQQPSARSITSSVSSTSRTRDAARGEVTEQEEEEKEEAGECTQRTTVSEDPIQDQEQQPASVSDTPLINICLRSHGGAQSNQPYSVIPAQMVSNYTLFATTYLIVTCVIIRCLKKDI